MFKDFVSTMKKLIRSDAGQAVIAYGTVISHSGGVGAYYVRCTIDGEASARAVDIPCLSTYTPVDTDRILLLRRTGNDYTVMGKIPT